jgi:hypothetical protein
MRIIFYQPNNRLLRKDGAEFTARALDAARFYGPEVRSVALPKGNDAKKRKYITDYLRVQVADSSVDRLLVFCHGSQKWCEFGGTVSALPLLITELKRVLKPTARIGLYCCLTGHLDHGGFAASLSRLLGGLPVMAHRSSSPWGILGGHTTDNPYKRMFAHSTVENMWPTDKAAFRIYRDLLKSSKTAEFEMLERWGEQ